MGLDHASLRRKLAADPQDGAAWIAWLKARARVEGAGVYLEPLCSARTWSEQPHAVQDFVIVELTRRLQPHWSFESTRVWSCAERSHRLPVFVHQGTGIPMMLVPGERRVEAPFDLPPFLIGRWPVLWSNWPRPEPRERRTPVTKLSWGLAQIWLQQQGLRLPSRREWVHACRAGTTERFYWGADFDPSRVWYRNNSQERRGAWSIANTEKPQPVTHHDERGKWNAFGLVDTVGNVNEWLLGETEYGQRPCAGGSYHWERTDFEELGFGPLWVLDGAAAEIGFRAACSLP